MSRKEITQNFTTTALHPGNIHIYLKVTQKFPNRSQLLTTENGY